MKKEVLIEKDIDLKEVYFGNIQKQIRTYPKKIECEGTTYTFNDGLQLLVQQGKELIRIFDMTDGQAHYRLRNDVTEQRWRLMSITMNA